MSPTGLVERADLLHAAARCAEVEVADLAQLSNSESLLGFPSCFEPHGSKVAATYPGTRSPCRQEGVEPDGPCWLSLRLYSRKYKLSRGSLHTFPCVSWARLGHRATPSSKRVWGSQSPSPATCHGSGPSWEWPSVIPQTGLFTTQSERKWGLPGSGQGSHGPRTRM